MRILFFSHYFPPEGNAPAARTHAHCRFWAAAGHDVTVVTCAPSHPRGVVYPGYRNRLRQIDVVDGVRVVRVGTLLAANVGLWKRAANWLSYLASATLFGAFERRPDVIVATSPQFFCAGAGLLVGALRRRPVVLEIRDLFAASVAAVGALGSARLLRIFEWAEQRACAAATRIVTVGEGYRGALVRRGADPASIAVAPNGVDTGLFRPRTPDPRDARRWGVAGRFVVAWCGTIGLAHGLEIVLRAARRLIERGRRDIVFLLAGDGARLDALRAAAAERGLDNVVFTGQLPRREIPAVLACADAVLVHLRTAALFETVMPSKIFESAAMARPLVLGVRGAARRFVEEAACGLCIEPENDGELVDAVLRLAGDAELRRRLGDAGVRAVAPFDRKRLAARYLDLLRRTVDEARAADAGWRESVAGPSARGDRR